MKKNCDVVGVIVPAFNSEKFMNTTIQSVVGQSYRNLEIIIVLGKSTDSTDNIAYEWAKADPRIKVINQSGGRLGTARNEAIDALEADYLTFVDADDWIDKYFVEKMLKKMQENDSDLIICNRDKVIYGTDGLIFDVKDVQMVGMDDDACSVCDNADVIQNIEVSVNGKLYKKDIFKKNKILQPDIFGEDRAIMHFLISKCSRLDRVHEVLYHYRAEHGGNSVSSVKTYFTAAECMEFIRDLFVKECSEVKYRYQLKNVYSNIANLAFSYLNRADDDELHEANEAKEKIVEFLNNDKFDIYGTRYLWGSYSLRRMVKYGFPSLGEKRKHYSYSSLISCMSRAPLQMEKQDKFSTLQREWFYYDYYKIFVKTFNPKKEDLLFIDFLDERFPVVELENKYYTYSTFLLRHEDIKNVMDSEGNILSDDENDTQWKQACDKFAEFIKGKMDCKRVFLVRNYLCTEKGTISLKEKFEDYDCIRIINNRLEQKYNYFASIMNGINDVDFSRNNKYFYSAVDFDFGCRPWHYNENYYMQQGAACNRIMDGLV